MHRHHHSQGRVDCLQLLAYQPQRDVIHALPAVAHRQAYPQDAQLCQAWQHDRVHLPAAVAFLDERRDFLLDEFAHHLLYHPLFF